MKFDVIIGNPPYNNIGKINGGLQTSGNSLWVQFLEMITKQMKDDGYAILVVPSAVGNTNSRGWKKIKKNLVVEITTDVNTYFKVGVAISVILFKNAPPKNTHKVNGILVDRKKVPILPSKADAISLSIFDKITSQQCKIEWKRDYWTSFEEKAGNLNKNNVIGMSFLDRSKVYKLQIFEDLSSRNLKKVNICWTETQHPNELINFMGSRLMQFYTIMTMLSGNLSIGMVNAITLPEQWKKLKTDADIYKAYNLTPEEIAYIEEKVK